MSNNIYPPPYKLTEAGGVPCIVDRDGTVIAVLASNSDAREIGSVEAMITAFNAEVAALNAVRERGAKMEAAGWRPVLDLFGGLERWEHENGKVVSASEAEQFMVMGKMPMPF